MATHRASSLIVTLIMVISAVPSFPSASADLSDPGSLLTRSTIYVNGDAGFNATNGVVCGDGSSANPYIIENHSIVASSGTDAIYIRATTKYFVVRNCYIQGCATWMGWSSGINIENSKNGSVHHNRITIRNWGITIYGSTNIEVYENNLTLNKYGLYLSGGNRSVVHDNDIHNNTQYGIMFSGTNNQTIESNDVHNNLNGIYISSSPDINLCNNTLWANNYSFTPYESPYADYPSNNSIDGKPLRWVKDKTDWVFDLTAGYIALVNCSKVTVENLTMSKQSAGILLLNSDTTTIKNMTLERNGAGVKVVGTSTSNTIEQCTINYNNVGVQLTGSTNNNLVYDNSFVCNTKGIQITGSSYQNRLEANTFALNGEGIEINHDNPVSGCNELIDNTINTSSDHGIYFYYAKDNFLLNNSIHNCSRYGIWLLKSPNNELASNEMWDSRYNFGMMSGHDKDTGSGDTNNTVHTNNTVDGKIIYIWVGKTKSTIPSDAGYVALVNCSQITVENLTISKVGEGIVAFQTTSSVFQNLTVENVVHGMVIARNSDGNKVQYCTLRNGTANYAYGDPEGDGIYAHYIDNLQILNTTISDFDGYGIKTISPGSGNVGTATIKGNTLSQCDNYAIWVQALASTTVSYNEIFDSPGGGIHASYSSTVTVTYNKVARSYRAIWLSDSLTSPTFDYNTLSDCEFGILGPSYTGPTGASISHNTISGMSIVGINMGSGKSTDMDSNEIFGCRMGMQLWGLDSWTMSGNDLHDNEYNMFISATTANLNSITLDTDNTVDDKPIYLLKSKSNQAVSEDAGMVILVSCNNITIKNLTLANNGQGMIFTETDSCHVQNVTFTHMYNDGIHFQSDSDYNVVLDCLFNEGNGWGGASGLHLLYSDNLTCSNCTFMRQNSGIWFDSGGSCGNDIFNNTFIENDYGFDFNSGTGINSTIHRNIFFNNVWKAFTGYAPDVITIYDNYLWNTKNWDTDYGQAGLDCYWNTTKKGGTNIVGGPNIGGNYWNNYTGTDSDSDGIGDTGVPFGPGDYLPLVMSPDNEPPTITDKTSGSPTSGDPFTLKANATDNKRVGGVVVEYWVNGQDYYNISLLKRSGTDKDAEFELNITFPGNTSFLAYKMAAWDLAGNWNSTTNKSVSVIDNDAPVISDRTTIDSPTTGDNFQLLAFVCDNVNLSSVNLEYWFDSGAHTNVSLSGIGDMFSRTLSVPSNAATLHYFFSAVDNSSNACVQSTVDRNVRDNDPPTIGDLTTGTPRTDMDFTVDGSASDNIELSGANLKYWYDGGAKTNVTLTPDSFGAFEYKIPMKDTAYYLHYSFECDDSAGNRNSTGQANLSISDKTLPAISDTTGIINSGANTSIKATVTDNHKVDKVFVDYWFDSGAHTNASMTGPTYFTANISVPEDALNLSYVIWANDTAHNVNFTSGSKQVNDILAPAIVDLTGWNPKTGGCFTLAFNVTDNRKVVSVTAEYWFDGNAHANLNLSNNASHEIQIKVSEKAKTLGYKFKAVDGRGNEGTKVAYRDISDITVPGIVDLTGQPTTGEDFHISFTASDNMAINKTEVEYWFDAGAHKSVTGATDLSISVPANVTVLQYIISVWDTAGLKTTLSGNKPVVDNDPPLLADTTGVPANGQQFWLNVTITENIAVRDAFVVYCFDNGTEVNVSFTGSYALTISDNSSTLHYRLRVTDTASLTSELNGTRAIVDILPPAISLHAGTPETGAVFNFTVEMSDNRGSVNSTVEYWYDLTVEHTVRTFKTTGIQTFQTQTPKNSKLFYYKISAKDTVGLGAGTNGSLIVRDIIKPAITDRTGDPKAGTMLPFDISVSDNIGVNGTSVDYWFDSGTHETLVYTAGSKVSVPLTAITLNYVIRARDDAGNEATRQVAKDVVGVPDANDTQPPVIDSVDAKKEDNGSSLRLDVKARDNVGVRVVRAQVTQNGTSRDYDLTFSNGYYSVIAPVDKFANGSYRIVAIDNAGLRAERNGTFLGDNEPVTPPPPPPPPPTPPGPVSEGGNNTLYIAVGALCAVAVIAALIVAKRSGSKTGKGNRNGKKTGTKVESDKEK